MQPPPQPENELARVDALHALGLLDGALRDDFERVTRLACRLFAVPMSMVSLIDSDRQVFAACQGIQAEQTSRDVSFCGHAILEPSQIFEVPDAAEDPRFADNPLVTHDPHVRFYAGIPLSVGSHAIGTLCIIDRTPRTLTDEDRQLLHDLAQGVQREITAHHHATVDDLTGLLNRRGFIRVAERLLALARRTDLPVTLLFGDLDRLKVVNDTRGHAEGDRILHDMGDLLRAAFRRSDVCARLGGDEFCMLLPGTVDIEASLDRLHTAIAAHNIEHGGGEISISIGSVAFDPHRHAGIDALLAAADAAMYINKRGDRTESLAGGPGGDPASPRPLGSPGSTLGAVATADQRDRRNDRDEREISMDEAAQAARRSADPERLLPGENPDTTYLEDALHWRGVYADLLSIKTDLISTARAGRRDADPAVAAELSGTDLPMLDRERARFTHRFGFWDGRVAALGGDATGPRARASGA